MTATKYFIDPFAQSGDVSPIPDNTQPSGAMSYNEGFTLNYQLPQTDPSSLDVPRAQFNQLMNDVTLNIQQYQQVGAPNFITTIQNGGTAFPYSKYSVVTYDDGTNGPRTFMSKVNSNTSLPTVNANWWWVDFTANAVVFDNATFDGAVNTGDAVYWDHTSSTFKQAIANGGVPQNVLGFADKVFSRVFACGDVSFLTGLTPGSIYYLSTTSAGQITSIIPASNAVRMGIAKSSSELYENIQSFAVSNFSGLFTSDIVSDGYEINNINGKIEQWGTVTGFPNTGTENTSLPVVFPIPFPNNIFNVVVSGYGEAAVGLYTNYSAASGYTTPPSLTGFTFELSTASGTLGVFSANNIVGYWRAIGN